MRRWALPGLGEWINISMGQTYNVLPQQGVIVIHYQYTWYLGLWGLMSGILFKDIAVRVQGFVGARV
jgi:hypothetical protein